MGRGRCGFCVLQKVGDAGCGMEKLGKLGLGESEFCETAYRLRRDPPNFEWTFASRSHTALRRSEFEGKVHKHLTYFVPRRRLCGRRSCRRDRSIVVSFGVIHDGSAAVLNSEWAPSPRLVFVSTVASALPFSSTVKSSAIAGVEAFGFVEPCFFASG